MDKLEIWDYSIQTTTHKIDKQQGFNVQNREHIQCLIIQYNRKMSEKNIRITESLCGAETNTIL